MTVSTASALYDAAMSWVRYDLASRQPAISELLAVVRLPSLSSAFLANTVSADMLIKNNLEALQVMSDQPIIFR